MRRGRTRGKCIVSVLFACFLAMPTWNSVYGAAASSTVGATVLGSISSSNLLNLSFGEFTAGPVPGTVVMTPSGSRFSTGGVLLSLSGTSNPAIFALTGNPNATYAITLPSTLTIMDSAGNTMLVDNFGSIPAATGQLSAAGQQNLAIGGTLHVLANQPQGNYNGSLILVVIYN